MNKRESLYRQIAKAEREGKPVQPLLDKLKALPVRRLGKLKGQDSHEGPDNVSGADWPDEMLYGIG